MAQSLENFPLALVTDGIISYIQWLFGNPEIVPDDYRWNENDRESRITISGPYIIDNERPAAAPYIVVERTGFNFENRTIDNLESASINTFDKKEGVMIADGSININVGSQVASEASSIANFLAIMLQAERKILMNTLGFLRNFRVDGISQERPVMQDSDIRRWVVSLNIFASIELGWKQEVKGEPWTSYTLRAISTEHYYESNTGITTSGSDLFVDQNADFGFETTNNPQLLRKEFEKGWYYIKLGNELYDVYEIVDNHTLRLRKEIGDNEYIPFNPDDSSVNVEYKLVWNSVHLSVSGPRKGE